MNIAVLEALHLSILLCLVRSLAACKKILFLVVKPLRTAKV